MKPGIYARLFSLLHNLVRYSRKQNFFFAFNVCPCVECMLLLFNICVVLGMNHSYLIGDSTFPPEDAVIGGTQAAESAACILLVFISPAVIVLSSRACKQDVKYCGQAAARSTRAAGRVQQLSCAQVVL